MDTKEQIDIIIFIFSGVKSLNVLKLKHKEWREKKTKNYTENTN